MKESATGTTAYTCIYERMIREVTTLVNTSPIDLAWIKGMLSGMQFGTINVGSKQLGDEILLRFRSDLECRKSRGTPIGFVNNLMFNRTRIFETAASLGIFLDGYPIRREASDLRFNEPTSAHTGKKLGQSIVHKCADAMTRASSALTQETTSVS